VAVIVVGVVIAGLVLIGDVKTTWSFSAFTVSVYYAITNLAALRLPDDQRLYGRWIAWAGLGACLFLAFWVEWRVWVAGLGVMLAGAGWHAVAGRIRTARGLARPSPGTTPEAANTEPGPLLPPPARQERSRPVHLRRRGRWLPPR
jgi:APA family basic amino acid/polyamine antiporter